MKDNLSPKASLALSYSCLIWKVHATQASPLASRSQSRVWIKSPTCFGQRRASRLLYDRCGTSSALYSLGMLVCILCERRLYEGTVWWGMTSFCVSGGLFGVFFFEATKDESRNDFLNSRCVIVLFLWCHAFYHVYPKSLSTLCNIRHVASLPNCLVTTKKEEKTKQT